MLGKPAGIVNGGMRMVKGCLWYVDWMGDMDKELRDGTCLEFVSTVMRFVEERTELQWTDTTPK